MVTNNFFLNVIFSQNHTEINSDDWTITKKTTMTIKHENFSKMTNLKVDRWALSLSRKWRRRWSSADRRCLKYIWVINNFIAYLRGTYIRGLTMCLKYFAVQNHTAGDLFWWMSYGWMVNANHRSWWRKVLLRFWGPRFETGIQLTKHLSAHYWNLLSSIQK